jgi:hypothetical protein
LPIINEDSNFGGLFALEDSLKFPTISQMGGNDFGWNFSNHSSSGDKGGLVDFQSPLPSPTKKRLFPEAFDPSFDNDFNGFVEKSGFVPFGGNSNLLAKASLSSKGKSDHIDKKPRRR